MATRRGSFPDPDPAHPAPADGARSGAAQSGAIGLCRPCSARADYIGGFVVASEIGEEAHIKAFEAAKDDYSAILLRALADRLAEAFAEHMHEKVRRDHWGYAAGRGIGHGRPDRRRNMRASGPRRGIPRSRSTSRRGPCSSCWMRPRSRRYADGYRLRCCRRRRYSGFYFSPP